MAGLATPLQIPTQRQQLAAIFQLRGRLFLNTFRRKGGKGEVVARILLFPFFALLALGPIIGAGFGGFYIVSQDRYHYMPLLLWVIYFVWQTFIISSKAAAPTFDLGMLIRFPIRFSTYLLVRLLFGLLDVPTVVCTLALLSAAIGMGVARPSLFPAAAAVFFVLDLTILFFFRMIFLWFDRWFAQRKTREILIGLFFVGMLAFQYVNVTLNSGNHVRSDPAARARHEHRIAAIKHTVHAVSPILRQFPPGLAATAITRFAFHADADATPPLLGLAAFGAAFLALFSRRLRGEFQGESFSETAAHTTEPVATTPSLRIEAPPTLTSTLPQLQPPGFLSTPTIACIGKELRYLTRSGPLLLALISPVFMVFILVSRTGLTRHANDWLLPSALAYIMLGLTANMYNIFGTEAAGIQLYFLAPIRLRDIVVAKNLVSITVIAIELAIASAIVISSTLVPPTPTLWGTYLWLTFTLTVNVTLGNIRSVYAPRVVDMGKFRQGRQGQLNALIGVVVLASCLGLGAAVLYLAQHLGQPWLPSPIFFLLAAAAIVFYRLNLNHLEQIALERREIIAAELCRT